MKKLLAIILAVAMVMSMAVVVSAAAPEGYEVGPYSKDNFGSGGWGSSYDGDTGVITYEGSWKGRGWWVDNYLTYDSMIIEFPGAEISAQVVVDYADADGDPSFAVAVGATSVTVSIDTSKKVSQIYIQNKADEALTLTIGDVYMRKYVPDLDAEPIEIDVSNPSMTGDNKNMAFNVGQALPSGETYTVHIKGTTDTDFRMWLGSLNNSASNVVKCFMDTTEFEFVQEIVTTGDASTVTLKVFNSAESDNYKDVLTGVTVTELSVFPGTKAEYEAWLEANPPATPEIILPEGYGDESACNYDLGTMDPAVIFNFDDGGAYVYCDLYGWQDNNKVEVKVYSYDTLLTTATCKKLSDFNGALELVLAVGDGSSNPSSDWLADVNWSTTEWAAKDGAPITKLELWIDGELADLTTDIRWTNFDTDYPADASVKLDNINWNNTHGTLTEEEYEEYLESLNKGTGYIVTGDETHAIIIGKAIITTKHEFDADGDCLYCRYHKDIVSEDIEVVQPTESTEEETEDIVVEEPKEDTNPTTGIALAVIPMIMAAAAIVISKR